MGGRELRGIIKVGYQCDRNVHLSFTTKQAEVVTQYVNKVNRLEFSVLSTD